MSEFRTVNIPIRDRSLGMLVTEALESRVVEGLLAPDSRINIDALSREMEVSQTPLRESLARLESLGLVRLVPQRGYFVSPLLTRPEFEDLFEFRQRFEPWAAAQAAQIATDEDKAWLQAEIDSAGKDVEKNGPWDDYLRVASHDARFHERIAEMAGNQWISDALKKSKVHVHLLRLYFIRRMGTDAIHEHQSVASSIIKGEPEAAKKAMSGHLESSRVRLGNTFF